MSTDECVTENYFFLFLNQKIFAKNIWCVLKTAVSTIRYFWAPKTRVKTDEDSRRFALKLLNWTNLRALGHEFTAYTDL